MRDFKFRYYSNIDKKMYFDVMFSNNHTDNETIVYVGSEVTNKDGNTIVQRAPRHGNLMQYTGLKDKNGVVIYGGDIVKIEIFNGNFEYRSVIWESDYAEFEFSSKDNVNNPDGLALCADYKCSEIVGNIYENIELLKENESE